MDGGYVEAIVLWLPPPLHKTPTCSSCRLHCFITSPCIVFYIESIGCVHVYVVTNFITNFIFIDLKATSAFITYTFVQSFLMKYGCLSDHYYHFAFTHYTIK